MDNDRVNFHKTGTADLSWLEVVRQQVESLRFGVVEITIHEGRVMQIEKTERLRLDKSGFIQQ